MNLDNFWHLIEQSRVSSDGTLENQYEILYDMLNKETVENLKQFHEFFMDLMKQSYLADLIHAVRLILCACSDDSFRDFRGWLIAQGKEIYYSVVADPNTLSNIIDDRDSFDLGLYAQVFPTIASDLYEDKINLKLDISNLFYEKLDKPLIADDKLPNLFPILAKRFGNCF